MFLGREQELESLELLLRKPTASLVACRGRRRIGKSTLFKEFARRNKTEFIVIEGLGPRKGQSPLDSFVCKHWVADCNFHLYALMCCTYFPNVALIIHLRK